MYSTQFSSDNWHREVRSITERNNIRLRRWGMRVTVYLGGSAGDYVLSYGLASTNRQDNNNWLLVAAIGATWGGGGGGGSWDRLGVVTGGAVITLAMAAKQTRQFTPDAQIAAPKTWAVTGTDPFIFQFPFSLDAVRAQTMPANFVMNDALWNDATKVWTPLSGGEYFAEGNFDGTLWTLTINGPVA